MGFTSIWHWIIVLAVVLILFARPGKISGIMGDFGKGLRNFKDGVKGDEEGEAEAEAEAEIDSDARAKGRRSTNPSINTSKEITVLGRPSDRPRKFQTIPDPARPNTPIAANSGPISLRSCFFIRPF